MRRAIVQYLDLSGEKWTTLPTLWHRTQAGWVKQGGMRKTVFNHLPEKDQGWRTLVNNAKQFTGADVALFVIPGLNEPMPPRPVTVDLTPLAE